MSHDKHHHPIPIPPVTKDPESLKNAVRALTEASETMSRQRGTLGGWMVTFMDLIELGIVTEEKVNEYLARNRGL